MLEELIKELIVALNANTAAVTGKPTAPAAAPTPEPDKPVAKKSAKAAAAPAETPAPETPAPSKELTKENLTANAQKILDMSAERNQSGDASGAARMKAINAKHGFKASTCESQTPEKLQAFLDDLKKEIAALEKIEVSAV